MNLYDTSDGRVAVVLFPLDYAVIGVGDTLERALSVSAVVPHDEDQSTFDDAYGATLLSRHEPGVTFVAKPWESSSDERARLRALLRFPLPHEACILFERTVLEQVDGDWFGGSSLGMGYLPDGVRVTVEVYARPEGRHVLDPAYNPDAALAWRAPAGWCLSEVSVTSSDDDPATYTAHYYLRG